MRKAWGAVIPLVVASLSCGGIGDGESTQQVSSPPTVWVQSASDRAFISSQPPPGASTTINLYAAQNEYQAAQILVAGSGNSSVSVSIPNPLAGPGGATIATSQITVTREYNHTMGGRTSGDSELPPNNDLNYTDALVANTPVTILTTQPYFFSVHTTSTQTPGQYQGTAVVNASGGNVNVTVNVFVYNKAIPNASDPASTFKLDNWFTSTGWDYYKGTEAAIPLEYGQYPNPTMVKFDNNWWTVIGNIAANRARHRNNVIQADFTALLSAPTNGMSDTTCTYSNGACTSFTFPPDTGAWPNFDRFIQAFVTAGAMKYIQTPPIGAHGWVWILVPTAMGTGSGPVTAELVPWRDPRVDPYLNAVFSHLKAHLDHMGWTSKFYLSVLDEPSTTDEVTEAQHIYSLYQQSSAFNGAGKTNEAHPYYITGLESSLSTFTPIVNNSPDATVAADSNGLALPQSTICASNTTGFAMPGYIGVVTSVGGQLVNCTGTGACLHSPAFTGCTGGSGTMTTGAPVMGRFNAASGGYDAFSQYYQNQRLGGKELWLYNSSSPQGTYMNRFITYHLAKTRLLPWLVWKVGGTGYLHWGWNVWTDESSNQAQIAPASDGGSLPLSLIHVCTTNGTQGFSSRPTIAVATTTGSGAITSQIVSCTGFTASTEACSGVQYPPSSQGATFTGCTGGTGTLHEPSSVGDRGGTVLGFVNTFDGTKGGGHDGTSYGDPWLVRPQLDANGIVISYDVFDSVRSENQLFGVQDFELLNLLAKTKPIEAKSIAETLIADLRDYPTADASARGSLIDNAHKQILDELVSTEGDTSDTRFSFLEDFSGGNDGNWKHTMGTWSVANQEYSQSDVQNWWAVSGLKGRSYGNFDLSLDVKIVNDGGNNANWAGVVVRSENVTDIDTGYLVAIRNNGNVFIYRSGQTLASGNIPGTCVSGTGYCPGAYTRLHVVAQGSMLKVYAGDNAYAQLSLTYNDPNGYSIGNIGLASYSNALFRQISINAEQNYAQGKTVYCGSGTSSANVCINNTAPNGQPPNGYAYIGAPGWSPQAAVDGQLNSGTGTHNWPYTSYGFSSDLTCTSQSCDRWITIDLCNGDASCSGYTIDRVDLYPRNDPGSGTGGFPVDFSILVSSTTNAPASFTAVKTVTGYPQPPGYPNPSSAIVQSFTFTPVLAKYLKIDASKLGLSNLLQFAEVQVFGGNLAAGKAITYNSLYESASEGWSAKNLTDGVRLSTLNYSMGYSSAIPTTGHEWVRVDLGGISTISNVCLYPRNDNVTNTSLYVGFPKAFTIQTSTDGNSWTPQVGEGPSYTPQPTGGSVQCFPFTATSARYVWVDATSLRNDDQGNPRLQFAEIAVY